LEVRKIIQPSKRPRYEMVDRRSTGVASRPGSNTKPHLLGTNPTSITITFAEIADQLETPMHGLSDSVRLKRHAIPAHHLGNVVEAGTVRATLLVGRLPGNNIPAIGARERNTDNGGELHG
jgi:hypothetical protein